MSLVSEAIARYHKLIESEPYIDLAWAHELEEQIQSAKLDGRPISPVLRPHFVTKREYTSLVKATETLLSAIVRLEHLVLETPELLHRVNLLPAERMLASVEGYSEATITSLLDTALSDRSIKFIDHSADIPPGVLYGDALSDLYYDAPPIKQFRRKHRLKKLGGMKYMLSAVNKSFRSFRGKTATKNPSMAIVELRQPFQSAVSEHNLLAEFFTSNGIPTEIVTPEQLDYKNGVLQAGDFEIDIVYRRISLHEFLVRYDLNHPMIQSYKDGAVCMVNNFRSEIGSKRVILDLLTDKDVTAKFPAAERKAIKAHIPWTRLVAAHRTTYGTKTVDLPEFILERREKLVLKPNDDSTEMHTVFGAQVDDDRWEQALRQALRTPSVVQEVIEPSHAVFPLLQFGNMVLKDMSTHVHPHAFFGKVHGASSWLDVAGGGGFSTLTGLAPTFLLEGK